MSSCLTLHSQLSSIMETMARSVLGQVYKLVDEDSRGLRLELSRLLIANSSLADKVNSLERELTAARRGVPELCQSNRSVGVQTVRGTDEDSCASETPTIAGIFGKDWCMNLWTDRDSSSLDKLTPLSSEEARGSLTESVTTHSDQNAVAETNKVYVEDTDSSCQQMTLTADEHEESLAGEPEQQSVVNQADSDTFGLSFEQDEQVLSAGGIEELPMGLMSVNVTKEGFSAYVMPIEEEEEEDDDDDVQFVQESQQEPVGSDAGGSGHEEHQLPSDNSQNGSSLDEDSQESNQDPNTEKFHCQICSREFFHKSTLTQHMKSHRSTFCSICKQHFPKTKNMISHTCVPPVPAKSRGRSCELCGKTFANRSAVRIHYVVHTGEKPHRCTVCGKRFTQKGNLKCHLRVHTGERPYRCVRCGKTFTQKVNLNHHLMVHRYREGGGSHSYETS